MFPTKTKLDNLLMKNAIEIRETLSKWEELIYNKMHNCIVEFIDTFEIQNKIGKDTDESLLHQIIVKFFYNFSHTLCDLGVGLISGGKIIFVHLVEHLLKNKILIWNFVEDQLIEEVMSSIKDEFYPKIRLMSHTTLYTRQIEFLICDVDKIGIASASGDGSGYSVEQKFYTRTRAWDLVNRRKDKFDDDKQKSLQVKMRDRHKKGINKKSPKLHKKYPTNKFKFHRW